jgi:hypothetical protein
MIEAWWRSLKHQWLFLHSLDSVTTVHRLVAFYVEEHNRAVSTDILHFPARVAVTPARMIERREDHDDAAQGVDGRQAGAFHALRMISRQWQGHLA